MTTNNTPTRVPTHDKTTRRRAATTVAKAYIGHQLHWVGLIVFGTLFGGLVDLTEQAYRAQVHPAFISLSIFTTLASLAMALLFLPLAMGLTIYLASDLYYLDTGTARAAMATKPDKRRNALPGDVQAHSLGAWPKKKKAGKPLGEWVRNEVHAQGNRLTATALPGLAKTYKKHGMIDDGRTARFLVRIASKPREDDHLVDEHLNNSKE